MSDDPNIEILRDIYAQWERGDFKSAEMFDPDVEFVQSGIAAETFLGPDGVREGWYGWLSAWEDRIRDREYRLAPRRQDRAHGALLGP
jgi:hypothetical protein